MRLPLVFASANPHKLQEIQAALPAGVAICSMRDIGFVETIPEPGQRFQDNALHKATAVGAYAPDRFVLSEDSGLEVIALKGAPGVRSARYAVAEAHESQDAANVRKLLQAMQGIADRRARFVSLFCLRAPQEQARCFVGTCEGTILLAPEGEAGFGYDPIFKPEGASQSFAAMTLAEKRFYSHREKALTALIHYLQQRRWV